MVMQKNKEVGWHCHTSVSSEGNWLLQNIRAGNCYLRNLWKELGWGWSWKLNKGLIMVELGMGQHQTLFPGVKVHLGIFPRAVALLLFFVIFETVTSTQSDLCLLLQSWDTLWLCGACCTLQWNSAIFALSLWKEIKGWVKMLLEAQEDISWVSFQCNKICASSFDHSVSTVSKWKYCQLEKVDLTYRTTLRINKSQLTESGINVVRSSPEIRLWYLIFKQRKFFLLAL